MLEGDKIGLFENPVSPGARVCLYKPHISVCEGHSPVQTWLDSPRRRSEEGNLCGQMKGGGMGWGWNLARSSFTDPCCCGNQGLCSAYHISIHPWEPSPVRAMRRSPTRSPSIGGLCCQGEMQTITLCAGKRANEPALCAGTYSSIHTPCCASQGEEKGRMIKIELGFYVHLLPTFAGSSLPSWASQSSCDIPPPFIHCLMNKIILHVIISSTNKARAQRSGCFQLEPISLCCLQFVCRSNCLIVTQATNAGVILIRYSFTDVGSVSSIVWCSCQGENSVC